VAKEKSDGLGAGHQAIVFPGFEPDELEAKVL